MTQEEKQKIREEFEEKYGDFIKIISVGQYNEKDVNIGFLPAKQVIADYWLSILDKAIKDKLEAVEEDCKKAIEYPDGKMDGAWVYIGKIKDIINKHK
jgi:hypothetical protein